MTLYLSNILNERRLCIIYSIEENRNVPGIESRQTERRPNGKIFPTPFCEENKERKEEVLLSIDEEGSGQLFHSLIYEMLNDRDGRRERPRD